MEDSPLDAVRQPHWLPGFLTDLVLCSNHDLWAQLIHSEVCQVFRGEHESFDVGRRASADAPLGVQLSKALRHVFAGRAAETLHCRADPLIRFVAWADSKAMVAIPFHEETLYIFACECETTCAPSFLKSLMSSLAFCLHILGVMSAQDCLSSMRLTGVCQDMLSHKEEEASEASAHHQDGLPDGAIRCLFDGRPCGPFHLRLLPFVSVLQGQELRHATDAWCLRGQTHC